MRLVTFAYLIFAILSLAGNSNALAGHSRLEMSHLRDDSSQMEPCDICNSIGISPKSAEAGSAPPRVSSIAPGFETGDGPSAASSTLLLAADLFALALCDVPCQQDHQAVSIADVSALAALRQHVHRSVVLHL